MPARPQAGSSSRPVAAHLHVVVPADLEVEGGLEGDVLLLQRLDVDLLDQTVVRDDLQEEARRERNPRDDEESDEEFS